MKANSRFLGRIFNKSHHQKIDVRMDLLEYNEDDTFYVYSPALDLVGYGFTAQEARNSWETILAEYFRYTLNKKTLTEDLENRGWEIKNKAKAMRFTPPTLSWMLERNEGLTNIYNNHDFHKVSRQIKVPVPEYA